MSTFKRFEEIECWKNARQLNILIQNTIIRKIDYKDLKLSQQIKSSAGSIMDNIAEGYERNGVKEFIQFLYISKGSCGELRSQIYRCSDFEIINMEECNELIEKTSNLSGQIQRLINYLSQSGIKGTKFK